MFSETELLWKTILWFDYVSAQNRNKFTKSICFYSDILIERQTKANVVPESKCDSKQSSYHSYVRLSKQLQTHRYPF